MFRCIDVGIGIVIRHNISHVFRGEDIMDTADSMVWKLEEILQSAKTAKQTADDGELARHWAIVYTELETVLARVQFYLVEKESGK